MEATLRPYAQSHERTQSNPWCRWPCSLCWRDFVASAEYAPGPVALAALSEPGWKPGGARIGRPCHLEAQCPPIHSLPMSATRICLHFEQRDHAERSALLRPPLTAAIEGPQSARIAARCSPRPGTARWTPCTSGRYPSLITPHRRARMPSPLVAMLRFHAKG